MHVSPRTLLANATAMTITTAAAMLICLTAAPVAQSAGIDLSTGEGAVAASRKIMCSLEDEKPVYYWWHGRAYSRVPGEADKLLFLVEGMNVRQCGTITDPQRGEGYRLVSREILLYKDPETGEVLEQWENPWTGETVEVVHVTNDPVNGRPTFERTADGEPYRVGLSTKNNAWWMTITVPLFYPNPLGGDYQPYVGGTYHATEMFNFMGDIDDLVDAGKDTADVRVGWVRRSQWLPWMKMGGRHGDIYMHTAGLKIDGYDELSDTMKAQIEENYPIYREPPPVDDARRNVTSWSYFRSLMEQRREAREETESRH